MTEFTGLRRLFSAGMRVFFLAAGIYAVLAMAVWEAWLAAFALGGETPALPFSPAPQHWHAHELIYGYACAVLGGFFLTAVPSWTGEKSARAGALTLLVALWLAGRLAVWFSGALDPWLVAVLDLGFLPMLALKIGLQLVRRPKPQNLMFLGLLALLWTGNLLVHLDWTGLATDLAGRGLRMGLMTLAATIAIIGGRVIPAFTRNAMVRTGRETDLPASRTWTERSGVACAILLPASIGLGLPNVALVLVALAAGLAQTLRLAGWRSGWTRGQPILWCLHLAFAMLALGYLAMAAAWAGLIGEMGALHVTAIGAIGGMTLAMMTRAALGHTGRPLIATGSIAWAFALVALAALVRSLGAEASPGWANWAVLVSGALWLVAFTLFLAQYWPILTGPRRDEAA